jgi:3-deoxy-D-manno-octulosonic-acid transferase
LSLASSRESRNNLRQLEVKNVKYIGNLKFTVKNKVNKLNKINTKILNKSKVWCAASTHEGEELFILKTHLEIKKKYNDILTIIIPRHINRSCDIKDLSNKFGLKSQILSSYKCVIKTDTEILIINSFGVLSGYFNYCKNVFIGKSLIKKLDLVSGQNPIEAAKLGCKIFHGPYVYNFKEIYDLLKSYGISKKINDKKKLSQIIIKNLKNPKKINISQINLLNIYGKNILNKTIVELNKYIK